MQEVARAIGSDSRLGPKFLKTGPGFGGSCFQKNILNLVYLCGHYGLHEVAAYWQQVVALNTWQQHRISALVVRRLFGIVTGKRHPRDTGHTHLPRPAGRRRPVGDL